MPQFGRDNCALGAARFTARFSARFGAFYVAFASVYGSFLRCAQHGAQIGYNQFTLPFGMKAPMPIALSLKCHRAAFVNRRMVAFFMVLPC